MNHQKMHKALNQYTRVSYSFMAKFFKNEPKIVKDIEQSLDKQYNDFAELIAPQIKAEKFAIRSEIAKRNKGKKYKNKIICPKPQLNS